jgi:hypothetical protein
MTDFHRASLEFREQGSIPSHCNIHSEFKQKSPTRFALNEQNCSRPYAPRLLL